MNTRKRINDILDEIKTASPFRSAQLSAELHRLVTRFKDEKNKEDQVLRIENNTKWKHPWTTERPKGGFEPIPGYQRPCCHPEHRPPMHLYIPPGQQYRHVCPGCGMTIIMRGQDILCCI